MSLLILFCAIVILSCIVTNKFSNKLGMPALVFFMFLGVLFGSDGVLKISFDDYDLTSKLCSIGLLFIIFYGGFCTKKPKNEIILQASLLSSLGTVFTALLTAGFCYLVLKMPFAESFLIGAIISSTDAASVFSILRSKRLNLKYNTAPLLEMESGSNDPFAYLLTILGLVLLKGGTLSSLTPLLFKQIFFGILFGVLIAVLAIYIFKKTKLLTEGTDTIFMVAIALCSFAIPDLIGGNGYLSAYITGIILGNSAIKNKINLIYFFDGITSLAQVIIFFLIGFLSFPHKIPEVLAPAVLITVFLSFVARPIAVAAIMLPFKANWNRISFISWAGLRGAASIVFAIMVVSESSVLKYDIFHIVFVVALLSVTIQGSLLPLMAKRKSMIDRFADVRKTFNDYQQESAIALNKIVIKDSHPWNGSLLKDISTNEDFLILVINRDNKRIVPKGNTVLKAGDEILIGTNVVDANTDIRLSEIVVYEGNDWVNKKINEIEFPDNFLIALIKRGAKSFVPNGRTTIKQDDVVVFYEAWFFLNL